MSESVRLAPRKRNFSRGYLAAFTAVAIWSLPTLFQYYLLRYYDVWSQNFYRYSVACLAILPFAIFGRRRRPVTFSLPVIAICFVAAVPNVIHQIAQTTAVAAVGPGTYAVFARSSVIIAALLALVFFPEERVVLAQWRFQLGTALGLFGAIGVLCFQRGSTTAGNFAWQGLIVAFTATACWACYSVLVKRPASALGAINSFALISLVTSAALFPLALAFGRISAPLHAGLVPNLVLVFSAVTCITIAHVLYYIAIRDLGIALAQTLQLLCPLGAIVLSAIIFHERLNTAQLASAAILLAGAFLAVRVQPPAPAAVEDI